MTGATARAKPMPNREILRERLRYHDGMLFWRKRPVSDFATEKAWKAWSTRLVGMRAGSRLATGYRIVRVDDVKFLEHRLIYHMEVGALGIDDCIDHIDMDRGNNEVSNLRRCSRAENHMNQPGRRPNAPKGVTWSRNEGKWKVEIRAYGKREYIGTFADLVDAERAAIAARSQLHGQFANHRRAK